MAATTKRARSYPPRLAKAAAAVRPAGRQERRPPCTGESVRPLRLATAGKGVVDPFDTGNKPFRSLTAWWVGPLLIRFLVGVRTGTEPLVAAAENQRLTRGSGKVEQKGITSIISSQQLAGRLPRALSSSANHTPSLRVHITMATRSRRNTDPAAIASRFSEVT